MNFQIFEEISFMQSNCKSRENLTTFGRSEYNNNIYLNIMDLTPALYGHYILAKRGQVHWLFQVAPFP
jgi:hypothetical protein